MTTLPASFLYLLRWPGVLLSLWLLATGALAGAYLSQYGFGLHPCVLCLYQRIPYWAMLGVGLLVYPLRSHSKALPLLALVFAFALLTQIGLASYHVGVEEGWWQGTGGCTGGELTFTLEALRAMIYEAPVVRCDESAFVLLGVSMAGWNALLALFMLGLLVLGWARRKHP